MKEYNILISRDIDITLKLRIKRFLANLLLSPMIHIILTPNEYRRFKVNDKGDPVGYKKTKKK